MTPVEILRQAAEELRAQWPRTKMCPKWAAHGMGPSACPRCRVLRLADDCDRGADELERTS